MLIHSLVGFFFLLLFVCLFFVVVRLFLLVVCSDWSIHYGGDDNIGCFYY